MPSAFGFEKEWLALRATATTEGDEGVSQGRAEHAPGVGGDRSAGHRGHERRVVIAVQGDGDREVVAGHRHADVVLPGGVVERGDVEVLGHAGVAALVGVHDVGVPAAVGVVHLDDDRREAVVAAVAPEHRDRVEDEAEGARVGQHQDCWRARKPQAAMPSSLTSALGPRVFQCDACRTFCD